MQSIIAFFMSIIMFFANLFGITIGVTVKKDVAYGSQESQKVDIYLPKKAPKNAGLILQIHGGGWIDGDKSSNTSSCKNIAQSNSYITASMNYRLVTEGATYKEMLDDITAALEKIKQTASAQGIEITSCGLVGYSAGAHLALLYSYRCAESSPVPIAFCASFAGPTNLADKNFYDTSKDNAAALSQCIGGVSGIGVNGELTPDNYLLHSVKLLAASPISYVDSTDPKTILCHGTQDSIVPYSNATALDSALTLAGVEHALITFENSDHDLGGDSDAWDQFYALLAQWANEAFGY